MAGLKEAARKGIGGDTRLIHASNDDIVLPREALNEKDRKLLDLFMRAKGRDLRRFTVGSDANQKNPRTRLPMFADTGGGDIGSVGTGNGSGVGAGNRDPRGEGAVAPGAGPAVGGDVGPSPTVGERAGPSASSTAVSAMTQDANQSIQGRGLFDTSPSADPQGYGNRSAFAGTLGSFGQPTTGAHFLDAMVNDAVNNPVATAINLGVGFIPGIGQALGFADQLSSLVGGPTVGSIATSLGRSLASGPSTSTGSTGTASSPVTGGTGVPDVSAGGAPDIQQYIRQIMGQAA